MFDTISSVVSLFFKGQMPCRPAGWEPLMNEIIISKYNLMMISFMSVSWNEFITALILTLTGYYVFNTFLFYRQELILSIKNITDPPAKDQQEHIEETEDDDILGKSKPEIVPASDHVSTTGSGDLVFSEPEQKEESSESIPGQRPKDKDTLLLGSVADLLEDLKTLTQMFIEYKSDREESVSMFRSLLSRYPQLAASRFRKVINMFIMTTCKEDCALDLSQDEIDSWWPA